MQVSKKLVAVAIAAAGVLMSSAQAADVGTVGDLSKIQAKTILLNAKLKRDEVQEKLDAKHAGGNEADAPLPVVRSIFGNEKTSVVTLVYAGNVRVSASAGDKVPGGYTIAKIDTDANRVELRKGKEVHIVGTSSVVPIAKKPATQQQNMMPGMPPMPMMSSAQ